MEVINFILAYWDFMLLIVAAIAAIVYAIFKGNKSVVMSMLYALVSDAEKTLGGGTGPLKLAWVIDLVYPKLPAVIKMFITDAMLKQWIEDALKAAKTEWEKNASIAQHIASALDSEQTE